MDTHQTDCSLEFVPVDRQSADDPKRCLFPLDAEDVAFLQKALEHASTYMYERCAGSANTEERDAYNQFTQRYLAMEKRLEAAREYVGPSLAYRVRVIRNQRMALIAERTRAFNERQNQRKAKENYRGTKPGCSH